MVQTISLLDSKELTPQNTNKQIKVSTNVDFLELLMKDIKDDNKDQLNKDLKQVTNKDKKENITLDDLLNLKDLDTTNFKNIMNSSPTIKEDIVKEVKNILESQIKQNNILMSKNDEKEFKSIDNIKDLLKFADKKGLNIQNIKFEIPKNIKKDLKDTIEEDNKFVQDSVPKDKIKSPRIDTKNILETKQVVQKTDEFKQKTTKKINIKNKDIENTKNISLENVLNNSSNKSKLKKVDNNKIQVQVINTDKQSTLETLITKDIKKDNKNNLHIKDNKVNNIKTHKKEVDLADLLMPKDMKKSTKSKIENSQNNINLNHTAINEIKARSVQASQTIESFKNNLDEAIKNYKPPISKVDIELNPKNLGKVEVSIVQRGNNIQVHMNTDQSNVVLFQNHQAEFRQALANIGFSNIDMSFNSNQDKDRKQNQAKKAYKENETIEDIADIEINASYQYA